MSIPTSPDITPTPIYNPMLTDFVWDYKDDDNNNQQAIVPAYKVTYFPRWLANAIKDPLATAILNERGWNKTPREQMNDLIRDEIEIHL